MRQMPAPSRYARQTILPFVGPEGQERLAHAHAVVVGVGALGCASADLLARAGVGRLTLIDRDVVERTNLQRQSLFTERDAEEGAPKADAAARRLREVNSEIDIIAQVADLTPRNAERLLGAVAASDGSANGEPRAMAILDGADNYETRYLLNDFSVRSGVPYFYAGAVGAEALAMPVLPGRVGAPCLRCVFPEPPPLGARRTCETSGVFGPAVAAIAAVQAGDALKHLMGRGDLIAPTLTRMDLERGAIAQRTLADARDPSCPCCAASRFEWLDDALGRGDAATLCGRNAVQVPPPIASSRSTGEALPVDLALIEAKLRPVAEVRRTAFLVKAALRDEPLALTVFADGRVVVEGTTDTVRARSIVAKHVGA